jgi:hypothetical protein
MKLKDLLKSLTAIKNKHGDDIDVMFDTEGAEYTVHMVDVDSAYYVGKNMGIDPPIVCLSTRDEEVRRHCTEHSIIEINNEKIGDLIVCTHCGKIFKKGTMEEFKNLLKKTKELDGNKE